MKLTKDYIISHIRETKYPLWALFSLQNYKRNPIMFYNGDDFTENETADGKVEKSTARLNAVLSNLPPGVLLSIDLKSGKYANGSNSTTLGPFEFVNSDKEDIETTQPSPALGIVPPGYVPESALKGLEESLTRNFKTEMESLKLDFERKQRESEFARREKELDEREEELKEKKKEYDSSVAKATDVLFGVGKKIVSSFFMPQGADDAAPQLGAMQPQQPQTPPDAKADAVDDLAEFLYKNFTIDDIKKLKADVTFSVQNMAQPSV